MTEGIHESTSSEATAGSRPQSDVVALGRRIVKELGLEQTTDTLARWMAHRLAELILVQETSTSERRRKRAARETEELVLRLWGQRTAWPHGWPPAGAASLLEALRLDNGIHSDETITDSRLRLIPRLEMLQGQELRAWIDVAVADYDPAEVRSWDLEHHDRIADDERAALQSFAALSEEVRRSAAPDLNDRTAALLEQLDRLDEDRSALREDLLSALGVNRDEIEPPANGST